MSDYRLNFETYLFPTPSGAYHAVADTTDDAARKVLRHLLSQPTSPHLTEQSLPELFAIDDAQQAMELAHRMQRLGWLQGEERPRQVPDGSLLTVLPPLLGELSTVGKALLADQQGFYLASHGFAHETAEELSALSADLATLYERHRGLLRHNIGLATGAWALVDAAGDSRLGCWPLYIGDQRFTLAIAGLPQLNQSAFTELVWALSVRYGG